MGVDRFADILADKARSDGVNVRYQHQPDQPTGTCGVCLTGHHRSLCAYLAAANHFTIDHIEVPANRRLIEAAAFYYISGFFLTVSPPTIQAIARHALEHDRPFMMNLSAPFLAQFFREPLMAAMPYVDVLFGNETEAAVFAREQQLLGAGETAETAEPDLRAIALRIAALPKQNERRERVVIVTQGSRAVLMARAGRCVEVPVQRLAPECIVDTNGAGDAFVGGFLAQLVLGRAYAECIRCGIWAAQEIIQRNGCTFEGVAGYVATEADEAEEDGEGLVEEKVVEEKAEEKVEAKEAAKEEPAKGGEEEKTAGETNKQ